MWPLKSVQQRAVGLHGYYSSPMTFRPYNDSQALMPDDGDFTFTINPGDRLPDVQWQLSQAITEMANSIAFDADGEIRLQKRLRDAYMSNLATVRAKDFPEDLRPAFESILARMTSRSSPLG